MEALTKIVVDCTTGETSIVPLSKEELAQREADAKAYEEAKAKEEAELAAKAQARQAILDRLGLTEEEAKILLG